MADQPVQPAVLGEHGEPCHECGAPLAADQRYCLNCGARRADSRVDYRHYMGLAGSGSNGARQAPEPATQEGEAEEKKKTDRDYAPFAAVGGIAVLGLMLLVGVLIGKGNNNTTSTAPAPVVQLKQPGGETAAEGESSGKSEATAAKPSKKGSKKVNTGATQIKGGLTGKAAQNTDATVQATKDELEKLGEATGDAYEEAQKKLPDKIATPGAPPPIDKSKA